MQRATKFNQKLAEKDGMHMGVHAQSFPALVKRDQPKQAEGNSASANKQQIGSSRCIVA